MDLYHRNGRSRTAVASSMHAHNRYESYNEDVQRSQRKSKSTKRKSHRRKSNSRSRSNCHHRRLMKYNLGKGYRERVSRTNKRNDERRYFDDRYRRKGNRYHESSSRSNENDELQRTRRKRRRVLNSNFHYRNDESMDEYASLPLCYKSMNQKDESDHSLDHFYSQQQHSSPNHMSSSSYARQKYSKSSRRTRSRNHSRSHKSYNQRQTNERREKEYSPKGISTYPSRNRSTSSRREDAHDASYNRTRYSSRIKLKRSREDLRNGEGQHVNSVTRKYTRHRSSSRRPQLSREGKERQEQKKYRIHKHSESEDSEKEKQRRKRERHERKVEQAYYYKLMKQMDKQKQREREQKRKRRHDNRSSSDSSDDESHGKSRAHHYRHRRRDLYDSQSNSNQRSKRTRRRITKQENFSRSHSNPNAYSRKRSENHTLKHHSKRRRRRRRRDRSPSNSYIPKDIASDSEGRHHDIHNHHERIHDPDRYRSRLHYNHSSRNHYSNAVVSEDDWEVDEESSHVEKHSSSDDLSSQSSKSWSSSAEEDENDDDDVGEDDESSSQRDDSLGHFEGGPGIIIKDRYKIVKDVGMGTFGRVVECTDIESLISTKHSRKVSVSTSSSSMSSKRSRSRSSNVAIKIVRNVKRYHESALIEADILKDVNRRGGRGKNLCAKLLDQFDLKSGHYCLVFECLGMSLYDFLKSHKYAPFPMYCVRDFAHQLLDALEFLHGFDLIHTDLKPENILLVSNQEEVYRTNDGSRFMVPQSTKIKVIDFGGASYDHEKKSSVVNTRQYRAPEVILNLGWSTPSDLWSAGCIIAELYLGELLFATHDNAEHLALMECAIGCFPKSMLTRSNTSVARQSFDSTGLHIREKILSPRKEAHVRKMTSLEALIDGGGLLGDTGVNIRTKSMFVSLLRSLLSIDPKIRSSASAALQSNYFKYEY